MNRHAIGPVLSSLLLILPPMVATANDTKVVVMPLVPATITAPHCRDALEEGRIITSAPDGTVIYYGYHMYRFRITNSSVECSAAQLINE